MTRSTRVPSAASAPVCATPLHLYPGWPRWKTQAAATAFRSIPGPGLHFQALTIGSKLKVEESLTGDSGGGFEDPKLAVCRYGQLRSIQQEAGHQLPLRVVELSFGKSLLIRRRDENLQRLLPRQGGGNQSQLPTAPRRHLPRGQGGKLEALLK